MSDKKQLYALSRRSLFKVVLGGAAAASCAGFLKIYFRGYSPRKTPRWVNAGSASYFKTGLPQKVNIAGAPFSAWVVRKSESEILAYDPLCTHIECEYTWKEKEKKFFCPCHDGWFDMGGNVLAGPPPRALYRYETKMENGNLYILMDTA